MPDDRAATEGLNLGDDFPPISTDAWEAAIQKDLKGRDYANLVWHTDEGITVLPYYRSDSLAGLSAQASAVPGHFPFVRGSGTSWEIDQSGAVKEDAVRADLVLDAGGDSVQQLGIALADGLEKLAKLSEMLRIEAAAGEVHFVFAVGSTYFVEIAKLRAARILWAKVVEQFNPSDPGACCMHLHARTAQRNKSYCDPDTNILRATTEAMAAAIGGCESLTVQSFGFDEHLATNIQRVLAEEAHLNAVADPAGGSYYIEALTAALAREAWRLFQRIEAAGGYSASILWLSEEIAKSRAAREEAVRFRRRTLVGVNNYPNPGEKGLANNILLPTDQGPFPTFRLAESFEKIRERTARHTAKTGWTPKVLLLKRGDTNMRTARANFALNFFGCAGFEIAESEEYANSDANLIVLCSSDAEYPSLAHEVCPAVRIPVIVAGFPKAEFETLQAAGVQGFIHAESDVVETLTTWQDRLGVGP